LKDHPRGEYPVWLGLGSSLESWRECWRNPSEALGWGIPGYYLPGTQSSHPWADVSSPGGPWTSSKLPEHHGSKVLRYSDTIHDHRTCGDTKPGHQPPFDSR